MGHKKYAWNAGWYLISVLLTRLTHRVFTRREWAVVKFLAEQGFNYQEIFLKREHIPGIEAVDYFVPYPETMREALLFVQQYRHKRAGYGL